MKMFLKKISLGAALLGISTCVAVGEWYNPFTWSLPKINVVWDDQQPVAAAAGDAGSSENEVTGDAQEDNGMQADEKPAPSVEEPEEILDYDTLGIKLLPVDHALLKGEPAALLGTLVQLYKTSPQKAVAFFTSMERANPGVAVKLLDNMAAIDKTLVSPAFAHELRLYLLSNVPSKLIAKILSDLPAHFKGQQMAHWGYFLVEDTYFPGGKIVLDRAIVKGEALPLIYIYYIYTQGLDYERCMKAKNQETIECQLVGEEAGKRHNTVLNILGKLKPEQVAKVLILDKEVASFKMGKTNSECSGQFKKLGLCDKVSDCMMPADFLAGFVMTFAAREDLKAIAVMLMERQYAIHPDQMAVMIKHIDPTILKQLLPDLSTEVRTLLPSTLTAAWLDQFFNDESNFLAIGNGAAEVQEPEFLTTQDYAYDGCDANGDCSV